MSLVVGDVVDLTLDRPAHGGMCVGRFEGQVVFARHGIPGERVSVEITEIGSGGRFVRGDVTNVLEPSTDRVTPRCEYAGRCGGCDWQHVSLQRQRAIKSEVIREQMVRVGGLSPEDPLLTSLVVEPCGEDPDGFGYRTRMDFVADERGRLGLRGSRSHEVIVLRGCPLAVDAVNGSDALRQPWARDGVVRVAAMDDGVHVTPEGVDAPTARQRVGDIPFDVSADGFWQVHRNAPAVFTAIAQDLLGARAGEFLLDLYGGVGLFARVIGATLGAGGRTLVVEADRRAGRLAKRNLRSLASADVVVDRVDRWLRTRQLSRVDLVVLDPPRAGAGRAVMAEIARLRPRVILYVACDPSSLARDVKIAAELGYRMDALRAVDAFPQTGHVESFARFIPA